MDWREYITVNPNVCHGQARVRGTRVMQESLQVQGCYTADLASRAGMISSP